MNDVLWLALIVVIIWLVLRKRAPSDATIAKGLAVTARNLLENHRAGAGVFAVTSATVDPSIKCLKVVFADMFITPDQWKCKTSTDRDDYIKVMCCSFCQGFMESGFHYTAVKKGWGLVVTFQTGEGMHMATEHISSQLLASAMVAK